MNTETLKEARTNVAALIALGAAIGKVNKNPHDGGKDFVIVPNGAGDWKVEYLERPDAPARMKGIVKADDTKSFCDYINRHISEESTVIYASLKPVGFIAVLNDHDKSSNPDWRDHRVTYGLQHSKEYLTWSPQARDHAPLTFTQEQFATFIENNMHDFKEPQGARMLEIALNFRAKQAITYKKGINLQNGTVELEYSEQNDQVGGGTSGKMTLPALFKISIPVWGGIDAEKYEFEARLRYKLGSGAVIFAYDLQRPHKVVEQAFKDVLEEIQENVKKVPVIFGTPE